MNEKLLLEGSISVKAALEAGRREVLEIITDPRPADRNRNYILNLARKKHVTITTASAAEIEAMAGGTSHGGLLAWVGDRQYCDAGSLLNHPSPFLVALEGIEDPSTVEDARIGAGQKHDAHASRHGDQTAAGHNGRQHGVLLLITQHRHP